MSNIGTLPENFDFLDQPGVGFEERAPREPIPAGWYTGVIEEFTDTKGNRYPRDEQGTNQRTIIMALRVTEGEYADRLTFVRGNYRPELITAAHAQRASELQKAGTLWKEGTNEEKQAFFSNRLIGSLRKAATAQGRNFLPNGEGWNVEQITNLPVRFNVQVDTDDSGQYGPKNTLNGFQPFDAVKKG